ncbi:hypothetical protein GCM10022227_22320 [Streptomyces sedi]
MRDLGPTPAQQGAQLLGPARGGHADGEAVQRPDGGPPRFFVLFVLVLLVLLVLLRHDRSTLVVRSLTGTWTRSTDGARLPGMECRRA